MITQLVASYNRFFAPALPAYRSTAANRSTSTTASPRTSPSIAEEFQAPESRQGRPVLAHGVSRGTTTPHLLRSPFRDDTCLGPQRMPRHALHKDNPVNRNAPTPNIRPPCAPPFAPPGLGTRCTPPNTHGSRHGLSSLTPDGVTEYVTRHFRASRRCRPRPSMSWL